MSGGDSNTTSTNRSSSRKISEASSSAAARTPSSKCIKVEINDLPDSVLVKIISRLPSSKFVCQCKCVSKRWCTLICAPYSICRFLSLQIEKQTPILTTLINHRAQEMPAPVLQRGPKSLARLFKRLVSFYRLNEDPVVVATYNDLVLCCANRRYQHDYYVRNPYTIQWVALPPAPRCSRMFAAVGFICDPYYQQDLILVDGGPHKLRMKKMLRFPLHPNFFLDDNEFEILAFDPNDEDDLYLRSEDGSIVMWNVSTGTWLRFAAEGIKGRHFFPLVVLPWWPTPVPKLPLNAHE